jgi:dTDP-glucose 4,6-dehydratase
MLEPSSPYSASKAGADQIALSFARTHGMDVRVSRCTNNYGPFQHPEKLIPLFITNALEQLPLPLYDGGTQIRDWLRVHDHCEALQIIMQKGRGGEIYNVGANQQPERTNAEITNMILQATGASGSLIEHRHGLRPGHDQRYAVSADKLRGLGWEPQLDIEQGIVETVEWYKENRAWWQARKDDSYQAYYAEHYGRSVDPD